MYGEVVAAAMLVLLAMAHSVLGETSILRPLFGENWQVGMPRWAVERVLRFSWHLTSVAWLALAAVVVGGEALPVVAAFSLVSAAIIFLTLRGHLAWPLFTLAGLGALHSDGRLEGVVLTSAAIAASAVLVLASLVHVYWASGGRWMADVAVPTSASGEHTFRPGPLATLTVAAALLAFAGLVVAAATDAGPSIVRFLVWVGVAVFALRAVGDTRSVGLSKSDHSSAFALADDRWFTPIVVFVALGATAAVLPG